MTSGEAALARFIASVRRFIVFAAPYIVFAVGVLLVIAAWKVLGPGPAFDWLNALLLALFVVTLVGRMAGVVAASGGRGCDAVAGHPGVRHRHGVQ